MVSDRTKILRNSARRKPPAAGKGRPKGARNKLTKSAKEAFSLAFDTMGGAEGLARWARTHPTQFYALYARLIPTETAVAHGFNPDNPPTVRIVPDTGPLLPRGMDGDNQ